jgi:hypothetical protein
MAGINVVVNNDAGAILHQLNVRPNSTALLNFPLRMGRASGS